jgi:hypothetical protein
MGGFTGEGVKTRKTRYIAVYRVSEEVMQTIEPVT